MMWYHMSQVIHKMYLYIYICTHTNTNTTIPRVNSIKNRSVQVFIYLTLKDDERRRDVNIS